MVKNNEGTMKLDDLTDKSICFRKRKIALLSEFQEKKLYEAFLESGPQMILQLSITLRNGISGYSQILTILTSFLTFVFASGKFFWHYPTLVSNQFTIISELHFLDMLPTITVLI